MKFRFLEWTVPSKRVTPLLSASLWGASALTAALGQCSWWLIPGTLGGTMWAIGLVPVLGGRAGHRRLTWKCGPVLILPSAAVTALVALGVLPATAAGGLAFGLAYTAGVEWLWIRYVERTVGARRRRDLALFAEGPASGLRYDARNILILAARHARERGPSAFTTSSDLHHGILLDPTRTVLKQLLAAGIPAEDLHELMLASGIKESRSDRREPAGLGLRLRSRFSTAAERAFELGATVATQISGQVYIDGRLLLMGLVLEPRGVAGQILRSEVGEAGVRQALDLELKPPTGSPN